MDIRFDSLNHTLVFIVKGEVKQAANLHPVINPGRLVNPKPWIEITKSPWIQLPEDETEFWAEVLKFKVFKHSCLPSHGSIIMVETATGPFGERAVQFSGYYPRYFWKGFTKLLRLC